MKPSLNKSILAGVALAALAIPVTRGETPATISVEGRGLPQMGGIVRDGDKVDWGFANFVAFGPGWTYTAQDYAAKELKKDTVEDQALGRGLLYIGKIWAGSRGLAFREEFFDVSKDGDAVLWDGRSQKQPIERFELRVDFPDAKDAASSTIEFDLSGAFADSHGKKPGRVEFGLPPPPMKIVAGDKWVVFPWTNDVKRGSILDFSKVLQRDAPAGQFGFARVSPEATSCSRRTRRRCRAAL